ncbi:hypothetical protein FOF68_07500 [Lactobacillus jensenii]|uniref:SHOCT domain-containing protein n=2 Tax=root TaxID=1 RepID=A0AAP3GX27_9LACO|nr:MULTISPECIES: SHOCT domain-containing protein [Lactobacillus]DAU26690.1 MAG TPA: protein of unknown function (DUF4429) [Caudoviricetes sp.]KAA9370783.1 hypothetical protein F6I07_07625 [Lactobacillus jensenii]MCF1784379.1 SHOCT domain-containing protein [Lactobacillus mulieris]MCW8082057.1 SHOCT domain-containing protein [Lactobacillus jensenii]MCW8105915.1 SHOCT domain-containing protein [Lactobacillus mulieris]
MKVEVKVPEHTIIDADDTGVTITRKGLRNFVNRGKLGSNKIPYWAISSVEYRKSTMFGGKIELHTVSGPQHNGGLGGIDPTFAFTAYGSSTAVPFRNGKNEEMAKLKDFIQEKIEEAHKPQQSQPVQNQVDPADELVKLKKLLDENIITQDEFDAKKKQLLGL